MRAAKVQASLRIRAVSPEPPLLAHTSSESRGTFRQKARSLAPLNGWACAVTICYDGNLEDTDSLDGAHLIYPISAFVVRFSVIIIISEIPRMLLDFVSKQADLKLAWSYNCEGRFCHDVAHISAF